MPGVGVVRRRNQESLDEWWILPTYRMGSRTYSAGLFRVERAWVSVNGVQVIPGTRELCPCSVGARTAQGLPNRGSPTGDHPDIGPRRDTTPTLGQAQTEPVGNAHAGGRAP